MVDVSSLLDEGEEISPLVEKEHSIVVPLMLMLAGVIVALFAFGLFLPSVSLILPR